MTTDDCPGCTACVDAELLTDTDRERRPTCGPPKLRREIDENPRPLVIDAPWIGWSPTNDAERAACDAWSRTTLIMQWRFTVELGPGTVIEPRTQPDGSICAGPWPVGAETITRTVWVRIHKHCGILAFLTNDRAELHPDYISSGSTPREAVVLAAQRAAGFGDVVKMRRFRSLRVEPVGPAELEVPR